MLFGPAPAVTVVVDGNVVYAKLAYVLLAGEPNAPAAAPVNIVEAVLG